MKAPFFSIIIPSYNYGQYIAYTIESLQNQSFTDWECIVIDDQSTDQTAEIVKNIADQDGRIKYIFQQNTGQAAARNHGLRLAQGTYIQFLDADDFLEKDKLSHFAQYLKDDHDVDLLYSDGRLFYDNDIKKQRLNYPGMPDAEWTLKISGSDNEIVSELINENRFLVNMPVVRATLAKKLMMDKSNQGNEDWDFWMRAAISGAQFCYLPSRGNDLSLLRLHHLSFSTNALPMTKSRIHMRKSWQKLILQPDLLRKNNLKLQSSKVVLGIYEKQAGQRANGFISLCHAIWPIYDLKYSLFALVASILPGSWAMNVLKKITGQHS